MTDSPRSQLEIVRLPSRRGVQVIGDVDLSTRDIWQAALESVTADGAPTRLELSQLSFIDVRGTAMLVDAARDRPGPAPLTLAHPPAVLRRMLTLLWPVDPAKIKFEELEMS